MYRRYILKCTINISFRCLHNQEETTQLGARLVLSSLQRRTPSSWLQGSLRGGFGQSLVIRWPLQWQLMAHLWECWKKCCWVVVGWVGCVGGWRRSWGGLSCRGVRMSTKRITVYVLFGPVKFSSLRKSSNLSNCLLINSLPVDVARPRVASLIKVLSLTGRHASLAYTHIWAIVKHRI